jgi:hypothetical protein
MMRGIGSGKHLPQCPPTEFGHTASQVGPAGRAYNSERLRVMGCPQVSPGGPEQTMKIRGEIRGLCVPFGDFWAPYVPLRGLAQYPVRCQETPIFLGFLVGPRQVSRRTLAVPRTVADP